MLSICLIGRASLRPRALGRENKLKEGARLPYYRINLIVLGICTFLASVSWTQVVPFLPVYLEQLGAGDRLLEWSGLVYSAQFAAGIVMAPLWGRMADRHGRKLMAIRAGLCLSAIYFLTGMAQAPWHVLLMRFLNGALTGFIPAAIALIATNTPSELAARYVASVQTTQALGSVVGPVIGGVLAGVFGIRGSLFLSGSAVFVSVLLVALFVREEKKVQPGERRSFLQDMSAALHSPVLLEVMAITLLGVLGSLAVQPVLAIYVAELAGSDSTSLSGLVFSLPGVAFVLTASRWVRAGQRLGYGRIVFAALMGAALLGVLLSLASSILTFSLLFFLQGVCIAGLRPVAAAIVSEQVEERMRGQAFGMLQSSTTLGGLIGPIVAGSAGRLFGTGSVFAVVGLLLAAGALALRLRARRRGEAVDLVGRGALR